MENFNRIFLLLIIYLISSPISGIAGHPEKYYQEKWCTGRIEVTMSDRTRCDCLTPTHAIELDFGRKWAEAVGQSLHYAALTGRQPGIVLILKSKSDKRYLKRLNKVIKNYNLPIQVWVIKDY